MAGQNLGALQCSDLHCAQLHLSGGSVWTQCFVMTQWQKQSQPYTIESPFSTSNWMWTINVHLLHDHLVKHKCGYLCKVLKNGSCKFYNVNDNRYFIVPFAHYVDDLLCMTKSNNLNKVQQGQWESDWQGKATIGLGFLYLMKILIVQRPPSCTTFFLPRVPFDRQTAGLERQRS